MGKEKEKIKNQRGKITFLVVFLVICILAIAQILVANRLATQGRLIEKYELEAQWLAEENQRLENEIIKFSSLFHLASRSSQLAFTQKTPILYLPKPVKVALKEE